MYAIELENVTKIYRKGFRGVKVHSVVDCSFAINKERITGFVGPNGAGKTTTIKMIIGLVRPTYGVLRCNGQLAASPAARKGVAYLSEQPYFYAHLSVREMLQFIARLIEIPSKSIDAEIARVLDTVELSHKAAAKVKELSKGMQQRLNMAQALLGDPHTLILDEPMSGMDPPGRRLFRELLDTLRSENKTIFFSTHVLDDIESVCDDVIVLQEGKVTYNGEVKTLVDEGFTGTDIVTGPLPTDLLTTLEKTGCVITSQGTDTITIFVNREDDPSAILRILAGHAVYPRRVSRRAMRLEELLYRGKKGAAV